MFRRRLLLLFLLLLLSFAVRDLTMQFVRDRLSDPAWFQSGSYALFDRQARDVLDGKASIFWIDDPSRTDAAVYPPGYPMCLAVVYKLTGERTAASTQKFQWILDAFSVLLIVGIGVTAYNWTTGVAAGFLAALAPLLVLNGVTPTADAPASWFVLAGVWALVVAFKQDRPRWMLVAGCLIGSSCWLRANALFLVIFWLAAILFLFRDRWRNALKLSGALVLGMLVTVAPLLIRNAVAFRAFVPTGLGAGTNLWEGIGETDRAAEFGAVYGDQALREQERIALGAPDDATFSLYYPDGVQRDRARARKAFSVILRHPIWYAGVMTKRMVRMLKYAGAPPSNMGSAGINVTPEKTLPNASLPIKVAIQFLGSAQSILRWLLLPLMIVGLLLAPRQHLRMTVLLLATVVYYLVTLSFIHSELRYGLPMHALLLVWAGYALASAVALRQRVQNRPHRIQ